MGNGNERGWNPEVWKCGFSECKHFATPFASTSSSHGVGDWPERDMVTLGRAERTANIGTMKENKPKALEDA
jgi:hypothetical protein